MIFQVLANGAAIILVMLLARSTAVDIDTPKIKLRQERDHPPEVP